MTIEDINLIRSVESYKKDILKDKFAATGLKERCAFNALNKFHICENVTLDVMHDFSEGVALYTISKVLQSLIKEKIITLEIINNRIESFRYAFEKRNKPRPLFYLQGKKGCELKIKRSSSEMLCLTRYLGLII